MGIAQVRKAITAAVAAAAAAFATGYSDGAMSSADWALVIGSAIVAGAAVFLVPNAPPEPAA